MSMDKGLRNTFLGFVGSIILLFLGAWVQINSRISILEVQVSNDRQILLESNKKSDDDMKEIKGKLEEINVNVTHLNDVKQDRAFLTKQNSNQ
nr:MAG TPA: hypothetical protein [Caudoviricetes sp.]